LRSAALLPAAACQSAESTRVDAAIAVEFAGDADAHAGLAAASQAQQLEAGFADAQQRRARSLVQTAAEHLTADAFENVAVGIVRLRLVDGKEDGACEAPGSCAVDATSLVADGEAE
jgi:hypothetical protein